jgi:hypothetical protein
MGKNKKTAPAVDVIQNEVPAPAETPKEQTQEVEAPKSVDAVETEKPADTVVGTSQPDENPAEIEKEPEVVEEIKDIVSEQLSPPTAQDAPVETPDPIPAAEEIPDDKILVDKPLFYKMMATCIKGSGYTGFAAMARFGAILGAKTLEEQRAAWKSVQAYLKEKKENGRPR